VRAQELDAGPRVLDQALLVLGLLPLFLARYCTQTRPPPSRACGHRGLRSCRQRAPLESVIRYSWLACEVWGDGAVSAGLPSAGQQIRLQVVEVLGQVAASASQHGGVYFVAVRPEFPSTRQGFHAPARHWRPPPCSGVLALLLGGVCQSGAAIAGAVAERFVSWPRLIGSDPARFWGNCPCCAATRFLAR